MRCHRSVLLVMEEFDLFASHAKQTLLYNLLDLLQRGKVQMAVIGVSSRLDNLSLLEKRVRSRFSHRRLLCIPPSPSQVPQILKDALLLSNGSTAIHLKRRKISSNDVANTFTAEAFNEAVEKLCSSEEASSLLSLHMSCHCSLRHIASLVTCLLAHFHNSYPKVRVLFLFQPQSTLINS